MEANLSVQIGADVSALQQGLATAMSQVDNLANAVGGAATDIGNSFDKMGDKAGEFPKKINVGIIGNLEKKFSDLQKSVRDATSVKDIARFNRELQTVDKQLRRLSNAGKDGFDGIGLSLNRATIAAQRTGGSFNTFSRNTGNAQVALTDFSRIVQDAPFGIIGVGNNITQLADSFARLRAQTGSGKAAFSAILSSLTGPAGIAFAISAVVTALTFAETGFDAWTKGLGDSKKELDKNKTSVEVLVTQYELFQKKLSEVTGSLAQESAKVQLLLGAIGDTTLSLTRRKEVIEELTSISPQYLGTLDAEKSSYEEVTKAVNSYLDSLAKQAEIKALLPEFEKIVKSIVDAQVALNKLNREEGIAISLGLPSDPDFVAEEQKKLSNIIQRGINEVKVAKKTLESIAGGGLSLFEILYGSQANQSKSSVDAVKEALKAAQDALQDEIAKLKLSQLSFNEGSLEYKELEARIIDLTGAYDALNKSAAQASFILAEAAKRALEVQNIKPAKVELIQTPSIDTGKALENIRLGLVDFNEEIKKVIARNAELKASYEDSAAFLQSTLGPAFDNVFMAIFEGQSIFKALGNSIKAMIAQLIAAIAKAAILAAILQALPGGQAAGGFGSIFKGLLGFKGLAGGGLNGGLAAQLGSSFNGSVSFEISGDKLIGVLNRTNSLRGING